MEINHYGDTILGVVPQEDIVEGRMVCLMANVHSRNFGSQTDLPGVKRPDTRAEAARARYVLLFEQDNRSLPLYQPQPHYDWALRWGWDQTGNAPFSATVYLTHPGVQICMTIPSGAGALAFGEGIYTAASGCYIYDATIETPGTQLEVANDADDSEADSGKLKVVSAGTAVAEVVQYHDDGRLTFKILH